MYQAVLRLVLVTVAVVLVIGTFIGLARTAGHQEGQAPSHPWFDRATWTITAPSADELCTHPPAARADVIVWLPVRKSRADWEVRCATARPLRDFLASSAHADWLIDVAAGAGEDLDNFVDIVDKVKGKRIGIYSPSQRAARALRKKAPHWVFAADDASLMRLHLFSAMFLGSVLEFWPDFVIARGDDKSAARLTDGEVTELQRRRKRIVWDGGAGALAAPFPVDGVVRRSSIE